MKDYLEESIKEFGEEVIGSTTSPTQKGLLTVDPDSDLLDEKKLTVPQYNCQVGIRF